MNERTRIQKDITMFKDNLTLMQNKTMTDKEKEIKKLAEQYYADAQYYLNKNDLFTAFGCINYAHGLLDALIKF